LQERNRGRIGLPRLADRADVTSPVPAIPLSDRICGRLVSPRSSMRKGKLIRMRIPRRALSRQPPCALSASLDCQMYF